MISDKLNRIFDYYGPTSYDIIINKLFCDNKITELQRDRLLSLYKKAHNEDNSWILLTNILYNIIYDKRGDVK